MPGILDISVEQSEGTIDCMTAPDGFLTADGVTKTAYGVQVTQQSRPIFGFSWQSNKSNALNDNLGTILHLAYGLQGRSVAEEAVPDRQRHACPDGLQLGPDVRLRSPSPA